MDVNKLFEEYAGRKADTVEELPGAGSNRRYVRFHVPEGTLVGCQGTDVEENRRFLALAELLQAHGTAVPRVHAVAPDGSCYLLEDLGDVSLFGAIEVGRRTGIFLPEEKELLARALTDLAHMQMLPEARAAGGPLPELDRQMVDWDLNYFKYCFLKPSGLEFDERRLQADLDTLAQGLLSGGGMQGLLYRDFQTRNIMVDAHGALRYIDFQGARRGPVEYDVASLLWQARARIPAPLRSELASGYYRELCREARAAGVAVPEGYTADVFMQRLRRMALFRTLQVLGAYGFRGLVERKQAFVTSIPAALANLRGLIADGAAGDATPYLRSLLTDLASLPRFQPLLTRKGLTIRVMSFSYRKGYPDDPTGNGGGFVFDCRGIHNPGRYEEYKSLTGRDPQVCEFIESNGDAAPFLAHAWGALELTVEQYLKRGFTDLQVAFGCTGGRHRSVYCAEQTARHLHDKYRVRVELTHRERDFAPVILERGQ